MTLSTESKFPNRRAYVLKLRVDATPNALAGRVENLITGCRRDFSSAGELLRALAADLERAAGEDASDLSEP
jgi:hypothetical protein